ncbi:ribosome recycling factor [Terrihabitans rhizophilus]|jgi:ribosome recycling factor|uniref:Ribosome-recycling factor n=1 Tax=Terrihabitans rhizophilus TaxID=3092662 RepID=A0ABU4RKX1_9HYPH|nr:ribosome recycling factor [Terrihabitans sp. PJ23]MDX6805472.1 ribosome recycling factor [Terrihabitans sp. PJ23]
MATPFDIAELKRRMQGAIGVLSTELNGLRTGRASAGLLDPISVDAYGSHTPLNQVASITVPEPRMLNVQVWDRSMTGAVERAIRESNLGLNPIVEGQLLRIPIPELNAERRKELVKVGHKYTEQAKVAVRNVRRDGMDVLKKMEKDGDIAEDDVRKQSDQVQKVTDEAIAEIDQLMATKEKEITQV